MEQKALEIEKKAIDMLENFPINDWDNFITRMKIENLYTQQFEDFVNDYLKFYNEFYND